MDRTCCPQSRDITMPGALGTAHEGETEWSFGRFTLSRSRMELLDGECRVRIGGRALELLLLLVERAGEVVPRAELLARLWPTAVVEDNSLRVHVSSLRKALGETPGGDRFIVNVSGRGYCFVGSIIARCAHANSTPLACVLQHEIPLSTSAPVGRDGVVADLVRMLGSVRLLTIVGPGGVGKSTVAALVARQLHVQSASEYMLVNMGQIKDGARVPAVLAAALGLGNGDVAEALERFVAGRELLFIFDDCEHVAEAVALLTEQLLLSAPRSRVLATSREPLCLDHERVYRLDALSVPPAGASFRQALDSPALQLFIARARMHVANFELNAANLPAVIRLCAQLDGNPLAIELAAARLDSLGVEGLAGRIDHLLVLLTRGKRTALPRHQTLQGLFDWSYELLNNNDRVLLARLSVFRAGFSLEWAASICSCAQIDRAAVVDSILSLSLKSLVAVEIGGAPVYRLLNTTRLYAADQLARSGEEASVRARHAHAMLVQLTEADASFRTLDPAKWTARYCVYAADLRAALEWSLGASGDIALGAELSAVAWLPMLTMGRAEEYRQFVHTALERLDDCSPDRGLELRLLTGLCMISSHCANGADGQSILYGRLEAALTAQADRQSRAQALYAMCCWSFSQGDYMQVQSFSSRMSALVLAGEDPALNLLVRRFQAQCLHYLGNNGAARSLAPTVQECYPARGVVHYIEQVPRRVSMSALQARALWIDGAPAEAMEVAAEAVYLAEGEHPFALCETLGLSAIPIALWSGNDGEAAVLLARLRACADSHAISFWLDWVDGFEHALAVRGGAPPAGWKLPANPKQLDLLGTLAEPLAVPRTLTRVESGAIPWCAAEILRAHGANLLASNFAGAHDFANAFFQHAFDCAASRKQRAWQLRAAISLARLAQTGTRQTAALHNVAEILQKYDAGAQTADLTFARDMLAAPQCAGARALHIA